MKTDKDNAQEELIETMQLIVDAEGMMHSCCAHISSLIKNARVREKFIAFSEAAKRNRDFFATHLKKAKVDVLPPRERCGFCSVKAESFSLFGALNLGLEITMRAVELYARLLKLTHDKDQREHLKKIWNQKNAEKEFLKSERKFMSDKENRDSIIDSYCIPEVISQLWK